MGPPVPAPAPAPTVAPELPAGTGPVAAPAGPVSMPAAAVATGPASVPAAAVTPVPVPGVKDGARPGARRAVRWRTHGSSPSAASGRETAVSLRRPASSGAPTSSWSRTPPRSGRTSAASAAASATSGRPTAPPAASAASTSASTGTSPPAGHGWLRAETVPVNSTEPASGRSSRNAASGWPVAVIPDVPAPSPPGALCSQYGSCRNAYVGSGTVRGRCAANAGRQSAGPPCTYSSATEARNRSGPPSSRRSDSTTAARPDAPPAPATASRVSVMPRVSTGCG